MEAEPEKTTSFCEAAVPFWYSPPKTSEWMSWEATEPTPMPVSRSTALALTSRLNLRSVAILPSRT